MYGIVRVFKAKNIALKNMHVRERNSIRYVEDIHNKAETTNKSMLKNIR